MCDLSRNGASLQNIDSKSIASSESEEDEDFYDIIKHGSRKQVVCAIFKDFLAETTINGARHFFERKRHWTERIFWVITFLIGLYLSWVLILDTWEKWNESPVIVSFAEKATPIWAIPFPAVTICPETKFYTQKLNFTETYRMLRDQQHDNLTDETMSKMRAGVHLCDPFLVENFNYEQNLTNNLIFGILNDISPMFEDTMYLCKWRHQVDNCSLYFQPILTEEGVCFTFNALNSRDIYTDEMSVEMLTVDANPNVTNWSPDGGYTDSEGNGLETYPYRVLSAGARVGLFTLLRLHDRDLDYVCRGPIQGFKILLHTPGEVPQVSKHYFRVPLNQEVLVSVQPQMITTSEDLRDYDPNIRGCFFNEERKLQFFRVYTQRNCELECIANFTKIQCGCVKFSMPRTEDTPICGASKITCYEDAEDKLIENGLIEGFKNSQSVGNICNCLPACTSITYDARISQAQFDSKNLLTAFDDGTENPFIGTQLCRLSIFFDEHQFTTSKRSELYGLTDFLANCGGLVGLFIGIDAMGAIEVIYYFTLRLCCTLRMYRPKRKK